MNSLSVSPISTYELIMRRILAGLAILLLILLISLFIPAQSDGGHGRIGDVRMVVSELATALTAYHTEYGSYPEATDGELIKVLSGQNPKQIVFLETAPKQLDSSGRLIDPWGSRYRIAIPARGAKVKVWSIGPDKTDDQGREGSDDIGNS
jgi:type II secretory pathway pseudopilin PulG